MATIVLDEWFFDQTIQLSDAAFRLYFDAVCWMVRQRTAGHVSGAYVRTRSRASSRLTQRHVDELVTAGLFAPVEGGWMVEGPWRVASGPRERISEDIRVAVYEADDYRCRRCGSTESLTLDHIHPRSRAGPDSLRNLQTLCGSCNSRKGARVE